MKYRLLLLTGALCVVACQALFGNLSTQNGNYCNVGDGTCPAGQVCDPTLHACVDSAGNSDGGLDPDGGVNPLLGQDFFAAPALAIPFPSGANGIQSGVPYKANFDNMTPPDLFIMGSASYTIVNFTGPNTAIKTVNYKGTGSPAMAAIGRLDDDDLDDVVVLFPMESRLELITSKAINPAAPSVPAASFAIAIGDYNGDKKNDLAIGHGPGAVFIYTGNGSGGFEVGPGTISTTQTNVQPESMVTVPGLVTGSEADSLALTLTDTSGSSMHRLQLILGAPAGDWKIDQIVNLTGPPTDLVAGNFSGSSRDLVVLVGGSQLNVFSDLRLSKLDAKSIINLTPYRTSTLTPLRGRLAVGRFYPDTVTHKRDDLAVLLDEGWVALAEGKGTGPLASYQIVNRRALAGDRLVAGDFIPDSSGRDDLVSYAERGMVPMLFLVRNNVGGSLGDLAMAGQHPVGMGTPTATPLVFTGRFKDTGRDDIIVAGAGPILNATRCRFQATGEPDCSDTRTLSGAPVAGAPITCTDQSARLLLGYSNKKLMLLDFTGAAGGESQVMLSLSAELKQIEVADINQDRANDLVLLDGNNKITVLLGVMGGNGCTFVTNMPVDIKPANLPLAPAIVMIAVGDANGDNYPDLVVGTDTDVALYINSNDKAFNAGSLSASNSGNIVGLAISDLRGIRKPEVVILSSVNAGASSSLTVLSPDLAGGRFIPLLNTMTLPLPYRRMTVGDLGSDGLPDLVLLNKARGQVTTAGSFAKDSVTLKHYGIGKNPEWLAVGQVDPDTASPRDIVVIDSSAIGTYTSSLWILQGLLPGQLVQ